MSDETRSSQEHALITRLSVVEQEDLGDRAAGYVAIYEELRERLEGGDESRA